MTQQEFIATIGPLCAKYAQKYGFKVASPAIAQACLESAYGTSPKALHHNYFGLKYREGRLTCNNGTFVDGGSEQNPDGSYRPITDRWYNFDTMDAGVEGYYQFINIPNYAKVKEAKTPLTYLQEIKNAHYATAQDYVQNVYAVIQKWNLTQYDNFNAAAPVQQATVSVPAPAKSINSPLVNVTKLSPNNSGKRTHAIDRITPHCVVGLWDVTTFGNYFANPQTKASCNYGIAKDGKVALIVEEDKRSWCSSSNANDQRAVTIECASEKTDPYAFPDATYNKLIELCADICKRNGKDTLLWIADKNTALNYNPKSNEMLLTVHRWFKQKACPGDWLMARMNDLATKVTNILKGTSKVTTPIVEQTQSKSEFPYIVQVIASALNIRKGPGTNYPVVGQIKDRGKYTITEVQNGFGHLKSGAGWISMKYTNKI